MANLAAKPYDVPCPKCSALPRQRCRSVVTQRTTDTHMSRYDASYSH